MPNDIDGGHPRANFIAIITEKVPNSNPMIDMARQVKNANRLNHANRLRNKFGCDSGDLRLIMISEQLVTVNATNTPADTKSSRYEKGTNVAKIVISTPERSESW